MYVFPEAGALAKVNVVPPVRVYLNQFEFDRSTVFAVVTFVFVTKNSLYDLSVVVKVPVIVSPDLNTALFAAPYAFNAFV